MKYSFTLLVAATVASLALVAKAAPAPVPAPVPCNECNDDNDNDGDNAGGENEANNGGGENETNETNNGGAENNGNGNVGNGNDNDNDNNEDNTGNGEAPEGAGAGGGAGGGAGAGNGPPNAGLAEGVNTLLKITGGIPRNDCITFRNNGEMVQAACVADAADRQLKPVKLANGADALEIQRTFVTPGFELKKGQICLMNNGQKFRSEECSKAGTGQFTLVTFDGTTMGDANNCITKVDIANNAEMISTARGADCVVMTPFPAA